MTEPATPAAAAPEILVPEVLLPTLGSSELQAFLTSKFPGLDKCLLPNTTAALVFGTHEASTRR